MIEHALHVRVRMTCYGRIIAAQPTNMASKSEPRKRDSTDILNDVPGQKYSRTSQTPTRNEVDGTQQPAVTPVRPKSEGPKAPLVFSTLDHQHPVCVSSLEKLYAEPLRVVQVLPGPLTQGSLIFLEVGHTISTRNLPEYV
jgi:hypothetical protein